MLLNTRPRVIRITLHLAWIAMLLQDGARAFAPPPQALQWRPAACAVSARGGQRAIGTLRAGDVKNEALSESQPTSVHAHKGSKRAADLQQSLDSLIQDLQESSDRLGDRAAAECPSGARVVSPERRPGASEGLAGAVPVDA